MAATVLASRPHHHQHRLDAFAFAPRTSSRATDDSSMAATSSPLPTPPLMHSLPSLSSSYPFGNQQQRQLFRGSSAAGAAAAAAAASTSSARLGRLQKSDNEDDETDTDEAPTPKDKVSSHLGGAITASKPSAPASSAVIASSPKSRSTAGRTKRRVIWDLRHRTSCLSSPKHRFHPYQSSAKLVTASAAAPLPAPPSSASVAVAPLTAFLGHPSSSGSSHTSAHSSSPSSAPRQHRRRTSSSFKVPRSILSRRYHPLSPARAIQQPSFLAYSKSATTSPYSSNSPRSRRASAQSPRGKLAEFLLQQSPGTLQSGKVLAEITKVNAGGRKHTVAFPDLRALTMPAAEDAEAGSIGGGEASSSRNQPTPAPLQTVGLGFFGASGAGLGLGSALQPTSSPLSSSDGQGGSGSGLGAPFEGTTATQEVDPRTQILSAIKTLLHSLAGPAWDASSRTEADAFDSEPVDHFARNIVDGPSASPSRRALDVELREIEGAYSTIFTYVQAYMQAAQRSQTASLEERDELDAQFEEDAPAVLKAVTRDVYNVLHPVPAPTGLPFASASAAASTKASREALLNRAGRAEPEVEMQLPSSSPPVLPQSAAAAGAADATSSSPAADGAASRPTKLGRSTGEMRRRRKEIDLAEAAIQCLGTLLSCRRFWRAFAVTELQAVLQQCAQVPHDPNVQGAKFRDLLSSFNWVLANTTLAPAILQPILRPTLLNSLLTSMRSSNKNGEKARRVVCEGLRAFRNLIAICPVAVLGYLTTAPNHTTVTFFGRYLSAAVKPLRENAALALGAIAYGMTKGWTTEDGSSGDETEMIRVQEAIGRELYQFWSMGDTVVLVEGTTETEMTVTLKELMDTLTSCTQQDHAFVRLVLSTLPILFGRRFRKMQHKGPHAWLNRALSLKSRCAGKDGLAFHISIFAHVAYSWALISKDNAEKAIASEAIFRMQIQQLPEGEVDAKLAEFERKLQLDSLWALGEKALRVIDQNINCVATPWSMENYTKQGDEKAAIKAAAALITTFTYALSGIICAGHAASPASSPHTARDLSKLWTVFLETQLPKLLNSEIEKLQAAGYGILQAILRGGEDALVPADAQSRTFSLERVVNAHLLGQAPGQSQASQEVDLGLLIGEMPRPTEIASFTPAWVLGNRSTILRMLSVAFSGVAKLINDAGESQATPLSAVGWITNEDGFAILPTGLTNVCRAFFVTLREASARATVPLVVIANELIAFVATVCEAYELPVSRMGKLEVGGVRLSMLQHLAEVVEDVVGADAMDTIQEGQSARDLLIRAVFKQPIAQKPTVPVLSAFRQAVTAILASEKTLSDPSVLLVSGSIASVPGPDLQVYVWQLLSQHWIKAVVKSGPSAGVACRDEAMSYLCTLPRALQTSAPGVHQANAFQHVLSTSIGGAALPAWQLLQEIASRLQDETHRHAFFEWSLLPLLRRLSQTAANATFVARIAETVQKASVRAVSGLMIAITHGLETFESAASSMEVLRPLEPTILHLIQSRSEGSDASQQTKLYLAYLGAFRALYDGDRDSAMLADVSQLLLAGLTGYADPSVYAAFASCWNATFGTSEEPVEYTEELKVTMRALLDAGVELRLPGWPKTIVEGAQEGQSSPDSSSRASDDGNVADVSHLTATQILPAATAHISGDISDELHAHDRTVTQMPTLSQIPEIPDEREGASAASPSVVLETSLAAVADAADQSSTDVLPETQRAISEEDDLPEKADAAARQSEKHHVVEETQSQTQTQTWRLEESFQESMLPRRIPYLSSSPAGSASGAAKAHKVAGIHVVAPSRRSAMETRTKRKASPPQAEEEEADSSEEEALANIAARTTKKRSTATRPADVARPKLNTSPGSSSSSDSEGAFVVAGSISQRSQQSKPSSVASSNVSRLSASSGRSSGASGSKAARRAAIIEVVIPYRADIPRPAAASIGSAAAAVSRSPAGSDGGSARKRAKYHSSDVSDVLKQVNSSSFDVKAAAALLGLLPKTASLPVAPRVGRPVKAANVQKEVVPDSEFEEGNEEDSDDEDSVEVASSPANAGSQKVRDVSDSLSVSRRRQLASSTARRTALEERSEEQPDEDSASPTSSPAAAAAHRRSSVSQSASKPRSRSQSRSRASGTMSSSSSSSHSHADKAAKGPRNKSTVCQQELSRILDESSDELDQVVESLDRRQKRKLMRKLEASLQSESAHKSKKQRR